MDREHWIFILVGGGICAVLIAFLVGAIIGDGEARDRFMAECRQHRLQYECTAMWRAGNQNTVVMPMPVIVGR